MRANAVTSVLPQRTEAEVHRQPLHGQTPADAAKTRLQLKTSVCLGDVTVMVKSDKTAQVKPSLLVILCVTAKASMSNECWSTLIKKIYRPKFSSVGTKSEAITTNV